MSRPKNDERPDSPAFMHANYLVIKMTGITDFTGTAFDVFKCNVSVLVGDDTLFTDDAPVEVPRQIFQGGQPFSRVGAVGNPLLRHRIGQRKACLG